MVVGFVYISFFSLFAIYRYGSVNNDDVIWGRMQPAEGGGPEIKFDVA